MSDSPPPIPENDPFAGLPDPSSLEAIDAEIARRRRVPRSPAELAVLVSNGKWQRCKHLDLLNDKLLQLADGRIKRLIVTVPPRHGKSELCSKFFPAWYLGTHPDNKVILCSYEASFASTWGGKARDILSEHGRNLFGVEVSDSSTAKDDWRIAGREGGMVTAGAAGPITGKGAHCVVGGTLVATDIGWVPIERVVRMERWPRVLSYNHATGRREWKRVRATRESASDELYEIRTVGGRVVRATSRHRFFVPGRGYRQASVLAVGDRLIVAPNEPAVQNLRGLREAAPHAAPDVPFVLLGTPRPHGDAHVRLVREGVRPSAVRGGQTGAERADGAAQGVLLFPEMCAGTPRGEERAAVPGLRETDGFAFRGDVLRLGLPAGGAGQDVGVHALPLVRDPLSPEIAPHGVLLGGVRRQGALGPHDGGGQLAVRERGERGDVVPIDAAADLAPGQALLLCLRGRGDDEDGPAEGRSVRPVADGHSPHQRGPAGQPSGEPDRDLRTLSRHSPQVREDAVAVVRRVRAERVAVYDLQVEGNSNFFAGEVLVHNCLIVDDPIKNSAEAGSKIIRQKLWDWWQSTATSRLEPDASILVIQTRWNQDDLVGRLLGQAPTDDVEDPDEAAQEKWVCVDFPALAEGPDELGRKAGDALWPERWPAATLRRKRARMGPYFWSALYQQRPSPDAGEVFRREWFRYFKKEGDQYILLRADGTEAYRTPVERCTRIAVMDVATSDEQTADYTVLQVWDVTEGYDAVLVDQWRKRAQTPEVIATAASMCRALGVESLGVEKAGVGMAVYQSLKAKGITVKALIAKGDKRTRARASAQGRMASGMLYFPHAGSPYLADLERELLDFPKGAHDDQCLAQGTLIATPSGEIPIERIRAGDWVLTRNGARRVTAAKMTSPDAAVYLMRTGHGRLLLGTPNHPVFVVGKGFVPLAEVDYEDRMLVCGSQELNPNPYSSTASNSADTPTRNTPPTGTITGRTVATLRRAYSTFIKRFGSRLTAQSPPDTTSTTRTETRSTTIRPTSNASPDSSTAGSTHSSAISEGPSTWRTCREFEGAPRRGTKVMRAGRGIAVTPSRSSSSRRTRPASGADTLTRSSCENPDTTSAPAIVETSGSAGMPVSGRWPVYNLSVEQDNEYFANGVLVHNCDTLAYLSLWVQAMGGAPRTVTDDAWDAEVERRDTQKTRDPRPGANVRPAAMAAVGAESVARDAGGAGGAGGDADPDVRAWLAGGWPAFLRPGAN